MRLDDVVQKYNAASRHYDRFMDLVFGAVLDVEQQRARIVELLGDVEGGTVVDVGCGTGRNFPLLRDSVGERGRVIGIDCSEGMLAQARRLVHRNHWNNVELVLDDAVKLEGLRQPVDGIVSAWCYGTVYDLRRALDRAIEVLRPGGRIAIVTFVRACPERGPLRWLYPLCRFAVRSVGIDPARDFDNATLETKWDLGRQLLRSRLEDVHEETYLQGTGLILAGRKPAASEAVTVRRKQTEEAAEPFSAHPI